jgi:hypothetical protein
LPKSRILRGACAGFGTRYRLLRRREIAEAPAGAMRMSGARRNRCVRARAAPADWSRPRAASFLGVLAILVNIIAPLGLPASIRAAELTTDGVTIVCTAAGPVAVDSKGLPVPGGRPEPICAFCLPLMQGALDPPDTIGAALACESRVAGEALVCEPPVCGRPLTRSAAHFARGPPLA